MTEITRGKNRWPLFAMLAWCGATSAAAVALVAVLWQDSLGRVGDHLLTAHYFAFMCQTFAYHAGLAMIPVMLFAALTKRRRLLVIGAAVFVLGAGPELAPIMPVRVSAAHGKTIKVMSVNLLYGGRKEDTLLEQIEREAPDVIVFQEWTPRSTKVVGERLKLGFPYSIEEPREDAFGQAVFSRRPFLGEPRLYPPGHGFDVPQITFTVDLEGRPLTVTDVHLASPISRRAFSWEREMAGSLARWAADPNDDSRPRVLLGDFNAVRRSSVIRRFFDAGLLSSQDRAGWWRGSTWPRVGLLRFGPCIRLDHALFAPEVLCTESRTGEDFGSDHRPLIVTIGWRDVKR